jgi:hypothetical protein
VRAAPAEVFAAERRGHGKRWGATGSGVSSTLGQLWVNSGATLGQGSACLFRGMEHAAGIGHGRDLGVRGDFVGLADLEWPERSTQVARPPNSHDTPAPTELTCRIAPDLREGEPTEPIRSTATRTYCDQHESDERVEAQSCSFATDVVVRPTHLQRAAHPRPDRVRCSFQEDRRVHTCGPEPRGGLL